jgi:pimeloyl-ACP methyl ester carboxylesterase
MAQRLLLFITFLFYASGSYAGEEAITLQSRKGDIKGTLMLPDTTANGLTIVLIIAGSGPTDRNGNQPGMSSNAYKLLAEALISNGIASLRYDKRGIAESKMAGQKEGDLRFDDMVQDAKDWVRTLAGDKRFSKIIIAGHSEGSLIGMLASENNEQVDGFISIAGPGRAADVMLREQLASQPKELLDMVNPMLDTLKHGDTLKYAPPMLASLFRASIQPYLISWFKYDPAVEIKKLSIPVLIAQGAMDVQVTAKDAVLLAAANPRAKKLIIPDMNHPLKQTTIADKNAQMATYSDPSLPLHPAFVTGVVDWVKGVR